MTVSVDMMTRLRDELAEAEAAQSDLTEAVVGEQRHEGEQPQQR